MSIAVEVAGRRPLATLRAVVDSLLDADLTVLSQDELLDALRGMEVETRPLAAVQHRLTAEVAAPNVAGS